MTTWAKIPEWPYKSSNTGAIRRILDGDSLGPPLKPHSNCGYLRVELSKNGYRKHFYVHRLVMRAFGGPCPAGKQVNHVDGDKANNRFRNLEYVTSAENHRHARSTGLFDGRGSTNGHAKLTDGDVIEIRRSVVRGPKNIINNKQLCLRYGISGVQLRNIVARRQWTHIP